MLNLTGKKALVTGIANNRSIAWGIAQQLHAAGAEIGITYLPDDKGRAESKVKKLTEPLSPSLFLPCNVQDDAQVDDLFATVKKEWGEFDILIHCLAFANRDDLTGAFSDTSRAGFDLALSVSAYSLTRLAQGAKDLMPNGGNIVTLTYLGGVRVVPNYNVMGVAKAALEASVRYMAEDLGKDGIRVNAISAGTIKTLAASGIGDFRLILKWNEYNAPLRRTVTQDEVGKSALYLLSDLGSAVTGEVLH
ncbi:MAG: enoyl-ACP reductase FabI, partial [Phormidesmis sp.]